MDRQVSLYTTHIDNIGRPVSLREILLTNFAIDLKAIIELRRLELNGGNYKIQSKIIKSQLQCFTPAALMETKSRGMNKVLCRSGIMQFDFDYNDIKDYDIEELKQAVFKLPFIGFCGLSCSGSGFYALALIAEPDRLSEYASQCFEILKLYGVKPDESKGKKPENLRYLSYDANMLIREHPEPLLIKNFKASRVAKKEIGINYNREQIVSGNGVVNIQLKMLNEITVGNRMATIQKVAYTLGGLGDTHVLLEIKNCIIKNPLFASDLDDFLKCADDCFHSGMKLPFKKA